MFGEKLDSATRWAELGIVKEKGGRAGRWRTDHGTRRRKRGERIDGNTERGRKKGGRNRERESENVAHSTTKPRYEPITAKIRHELSAAELLIAAEALADSALPLL